MENKFTQRELGFLEGIIDGEGCIGLYKEKTKYGTITFKPEFCISNTNYLLIKRIRKR